MMLNRRSQSITLSMPKGLSAKLKISTTTGSYRYQSLNNLNNRHLLFSALKTRSLRSEQECGWILIKTSLVCSWSSTHPCWCGLSPHCAYEKKQQAPGISFSMSTNPIISAILSWPRLALITPSRPVVWQTFSGKMQHTCLPIPDREPMRDESTDTITVLLGEPRVLLGYLKEYGWGTYRSRNDSDSCITETYPAWMTAHKAGNLEHSIHLASSLMGCRVSFSDAPGSIFQAAGLVWKSLQLFPWQSLLCSSVCLRVFVSWLPSF